MLLIIITRHLRSSNLLVAHFSYVQIPPAARFLSVPKSFLQTQTLVFEPKVLMLYLARRVHDILNLFSFTLFHNSSDCNKVHERKYTIFPNTNTGKVGCLRKLLSWNNFPTKVCVSFSMQSLIPFSGTISPHFRYKFLFDDNFVLRV